MNGCSGSVTRIRRNHFPSATSRSFIRSTSNESAPREPFTSNVLWLIRPVASRDASSVPTTPLSNSTVAANVSSTPWPSMNVFVTALIATGSPTR